MNLKQLLYFFVFNAMAPGVNAQTTAVFTTPATWVVPAGVSFVSVKVYGGGAGTGGQDCGAGCTNAAAGPAGYVLATYSVVPGNTIGIYPGGKGANGANNVTGSGGGAGGVATYSTAYNGGAGGNAGSLGTSGGGGGGGAASVVTINSVIRIVAGGGSGGGGMGNAAGSGLPGTSATSSSGTTLGGNGTTPSGDGGGGGGGGGGQFGSLGGGVHAAGIERAGDGGFIGANSVTGASVITANGNIAWTNGGRIEITFTIVLPLTWKFFTVNKEVDAALLRWATITEQNTKDYIIQRSSNNTDWKMIGQVNAVGNSNSEQQYQFADVYPLSSISYYRLLQRDINGQSSYSNTVVYKDVRLSNNFNVYPNPVVNGKAIVSIKEAGVVSVYNSTGTMVLRQTFQTGNHLLTLSALSSGIYCVKSKSATVLLYIQ